MTRRLIDRVLNPIRWRFVSEIYEAETEKYLSTMGPADREIVERVRPYTMTSIPRLCSLIEAVRYCARRGVPGDFAECGVWRGGSVMAMIYTLQEMGETQRNVHLFDTFEGMTPPTQYDSSPYHPHPLAIWRELERGGRHDSSWVFELPVSPLDSVREAVLSTGYDPGRIHFVKGPVEETLPDQAPDRLALLRLDTDWYESTRHELTHLYPRLSRGGVLIVDDYGHWDGCRRAVNEYFGSVSDPPLLTPIDYSGRIAIRY
jgi:O-methyltransferase